MESRRSRKTLTRFPEEEWRGSRGIDSDWDFGRRIRTVRVYQGLSQEEVARYLGLNRSTYTYYEVGKSRPNLVILKKLCEYLRVSPEFLLDIYIPKDKDES